IANDPLNPSPYSTQALARYIFGDLARAERDVRHAIALSPESGCRWIRCCGRSRTILALPH
ncbi:MAG: hypothetical protein M3O26_14585, partial [Pseudomonadota bacterium]|nr:hypothetical protein [Pseudomonadota bacterium]